MIATKIQEKVQAHYDFLKKIVPEEQIIGVFAYGSMNYGFYEDGVSDVDTKAVILPSLLHIVQGEKLTSMELQLPNGEHCEVKDIRLYVQQLKKQSINFIETLYTPFYVLNPLWEQMWNEYFIAHRCKIAHYNSYATIQAAAHHLLSIKGRKGKDLYNILRLSNFIDRYYFRYGYSSCINVTYTLPRNELQTMQNYKKQKDVDFSQDNKSILLIANIREKIKFLMNLDQYPTVNQQEEIRNQKTINNLLTKCVTSMLRSVFNNEDS